MTRPVGTVVLGASEGTGVSPDMPQGASRRPVRCGPRREGTVTVCFDWASRSTSTARPASSAASPHHIALAAAARLILQGPVLLQVLPTGSEQQRSGRAGDGGASVGLIDRDHGGTRVGRQRVTLALERGDQLVGVGVALGRVLGQGTQHDGVERVAAAPGSARSAGAGWPRPA